jgi:pSer/pThr/pTyr-binding forkhead associated (FHA) protein
MIIVGRERPCDVVVNRPNVSAVHAVLEVVGPGKVWVRDLDSSNGTFVNGRRLAAEVVTLEDHLQLGSWTADAREMLRQAAASRSDVTRDVVVGRSETNDVVVPDPRVSARHALLRPVSDCSVLVVDLGSSNGTFVNDVNVAWAAVRPSDRVRFGSLLVDPFRFLETALLRVAPTAGHHGQHLPVLSDVAESTSERHEPSDPSPLVSATRQSANGGSRWLSRRSLAAAIAVALIGVAAGLFFMGKIPPYWFRPYQDPWPRALEMARESLAATPGIERVLEGHSMNAESLVANLEVLDQVKPVLDRIDAWRRQKVPGMLGSAITFLSEMSDGSIPDNPYDAVLLALDRVGPGAGDALRSLENAVRESFANMADLRSIQRQSGDLATALRACRAEPSRAAFLVIDREADSLSTLLSSSSSNLETLQSNLSSALGGIALLKAAVSLAIGTSVGRTVEDQLGQVARFAGQVAGPLEDAQVKLNRIVVELPRDLERIRPMLDAVDAAQSSDELQRRRHARGAPER